jgi:hypothetical protein
MAIPQNLDLDASRRAYYTETVGANTLDNDALYNKFLQIKTGKTNLSTNDMALIYWRGLAARPNGSLMDCQNTMFNPYMSEELLYLRAQA